MQRLIPKVFCATQDIKSKTLIELQNTCNQCFGCALAKTRNNVVFGAGNPDAKILLIAEAPGSDEDLLGEPFVGMAGQLLDKFLIDAGLDRDTELYLCNTVKCRPPHNRVPSNEEKAACRTYLLGQIAIIRPRIILLCGSTAAESFINQDFRVSDIRGKWLNIFEDIDTMVIFHPSYLLRNHSVDENSPRRLMVKDLLNVKKKLLEFETFYE